MNRLLLIVFASTILFSCHSKSSTIDSSNIETEKKEVARAEQNMFNAIRTNDPNFWQTVSDSYITINADGVMANKQQSINDSLRRKMFIGIDHKLFDHTIKVFGNVGICNGRAQFFMQDQMGGRSLLYCNFPQREWQLGLRRLAGNNDQKQSKTCIRKSVLNIKSEIPRSHFLILCLFYFTFKNLQKPNKRL